MINRLFNHFNSVLSESELKQWFLPLKIIYSNKEEKIIKVIFPHSLFATWFLQKARSEFEFEFKKCLGDYEIKYLTCDEQEIFIFKENPQDNINTLIETPVSLSLDAKHSFQNFIYNNKNFFPINAAKKIIKSEEYNYFPFIISGESGSGKSHLLSAMVSRFKKQNKLNKFFHGKTKSFLNIANIFSKEKTAFFFDDFQEICGNTELQSKFISFYDHANKNNILLVICIDGHPVGYNKLNQKVRMRLSSGLVIELKKPDLDIRLRYILNKSDELKLEIDKKTALSLAQRYYDFRSIKGSLNVLASYKKILKKTGKNLNLILGSDSKKNIINPLYIINNAATYYNINPDDITGKKRNKNICKARQMAIYLCRELIGLPFTQIGKFFGERDHSSILYAVKKINTLRQSNKDTNNELKELKELCINSR